MSNSNDKYSRLDEKPSGTTSINMSESTTRKGPEHQNEEAPPSRLLVFGTVMFYLVAAIVMIMANKWVLNSVPVPAFFLFCQLGIAVILLRAAATFGFFVLPKLDLQVCLGIWPLIAVNVVGLLFNTYCLQFVDASFYQVARGLVLPFTVFFSYTLLGSKSSFATLVAVAIVCVGFFLGVSAEHLTVSTLGVVMGVASSITTSVHAIIVKRSLSKVPSSLDLAYYSNLLSAVVVLPVVFVAGEIPVIMTMIFGEEGQQGQAPNNNAGVLSAGNDGQLKTFTAGVLITGFFGFLICIAGFLSIKVTSPVTHMISSACRGVLQTFLGTWLFGDIITTGRATGIGVILFGSALYTWTRDQEMQKTKNQQQQHQQQQQHNQHQQTSYNSSPDLTSNSSRSASPVIDNNANATSRSSINTTHRPVKSFFDPANDGRRERERQY